MTARKDNLWQGDSPAAAETLLASLSNRFPGAVAANVPFGDSVADFVITNPDRIIVVELKTGDPELPLPSSTVPQMRRFKTAALSGCSGRRVIPLVVTNYQVSESDMSALKKEGVRIVSVMSPPDVEARVSEFVQEMKDEETPAIGA